MALKITGGVEPLTVLVNGVPARRAPTAARCSSSPTGRAFVRLTVIDARGAADSVMVRLQ